MLPTLIALSVFVGYFIESAFGFGGTIIALAGVGQLVDVKDAILIVTYASMCASSFVLLSDLKSFSWQHLIKIYTFALPGLLLGTFIFTILQSAVLLKIFAVLLIAYALYSLANPKLCLPYFLSRFVLFVAGLLQGIYATGAPFVLMGYGDKFENKSELRSAVAAFLLFGNVIRLVQLSVMGELKGGVFKDYWWIVVPIAIAVASGFFVHCRINDQLFKRGVFVLMLIAGIFYLVK